MKLKKGIKRFLILIILIGIGVGGYFYFLPNKTKKKAVVVDSISGYGYKLQDNKNSYYKKQFAKLKEVLDSDEVDYEKYAKILTKLFVADFYSLDDKIAKTDVGGVEFVYKDAKSVFLEKSEDTLYKYVENNLYGEREQKLPSVKSVTIKEVEQVPFTYLEEEDSEAYSVEATWKYSKNGKGYQTSGTFVFVHDGKKLSLVEIS